ncbi:hypothetical protein I2485_04570 [Nesterenkonia sp. E16_7]|uniref:hypothetical protein n=1 Tax=unclassified Nesterenkonia TaxID=2629769 RepID=UPI001A936068|nr:MULTISPECIES: hypothetical protein [unclassified Nesterenkonia]MBO0596687.1 hypothetical protein [Nesterenkonia sp. E16_10]MBO0597919.1 hypothetical protein [Nesterenkonia sp. E16_7]
MSKYYVNKFLFTIDRDPEWVARYREDPRATVVRWEKEIGRWLNPVEQTSWLEFTHQEREALATHDYVWLFEHGAHFFLNLTLFIALFDEEYAAAKGPLAFQTEMVRKLGHWTGRDYPSVAM